jgi:hypothetical protein
VEGAAQAAVTAEDHFLCFDWAHRQGALAWELRAATSSLGCTINRIGSPKRGSPGAGIRSVHRGFRNGRSESREGAAQRLRIARKVRCAA